MQAQLLWRIDAGQTVEMDSRCVHRIAKGPGHRTIQSKGIKESVLRCRDSSLKADGMDTG
jgi:hypothetical protein